ncbi:MAG: hypothetical protein ACW98F_07225, partial [Candidatus Hodarchaeales archaeon]
PDGWKCIPESQEFSELNLKNPQNFMFQVQLPESAKSSTNRITVKISSPSGEISKKLSVLVFNKSPKPHITELAPIKEKNITKVQNASLAIKASKDFVGALTSIKYKETEYLHSNFPSMVPSLFFNQDPAGLLTILLGQNDDLGDLTFFKEKYLKSEVHNDPWYGVEYTVNIAERKSLKGLIYKTSFELLGGDSTLLKVKLSVSNPTSATFQFLSLTVLTPAINGSIEGILSHLNISDTALHHAFSRENPQPLFALGSKSLERLDYVKEGKIISVVAPESDSNLFPLDAGKMILGGGVAKFWNLEPNKSDSCTFFLIVDSAHGIKSEDIAKIFDK